MNFNEVRFYNVDLTLTDNCNMACTYCFERGHFQNNIFADLSLFFKRIDELLESSFFKRHFDMLNIGFWGGEPTLNPQAIFEIISRYEKDSRVKYFLFTNGLNIESFKDTLLKFRDINIHQHPKLCTQISYDGMPIHDITRVSRGKKLTSSIIKENILWIDSHQIPNTIKSTVTLQAFKYLPDAYSDILSIWNPSATHFRNDKFFPTIDYNNLNDYTDLEFETSKKELNDALIKLSRLDLEFFRKYNRFFFSWFSPNKAICSAGRDLVAIDIDGSIYKCHGCLYEKGKKDHFITKLSSSSFIRDLDSSYLLHDINFGELPNDCVNCVSTFCLKCNVAKYEESNQSNYLKKWRDYSIQKRLCEFYQMNGKIVMAINKIIR